MPEGRHTRKSVTKGVYLARCDDNVNERLRKNVEARERTRKYREKLAMQAGELTGNAQK